MAQKTLHQKNSGKRRYKKKKTPSLMAARKSLNKQLNKKSLFTSYKKPDLFETMAETGQMFSDYG